MHTYSACRFLVILEILKAQITKELSLCATNSSFLIPYLCRRAKIFQTSNSVISNNVILKYQRFTPSGCIDIGIRKLKFCGKDSIPFIFIFRYRPPDVLLGQTNYTTSLGIKLHNQSRY